MFTRTLGRSGIEASALGLGCWAIGGPFTGGDGQPAGWGEVNDEESIKAIHCALEMGVTFFDTADAYGTGHSEAVLARALADRRDKVVIATKFGNTYDEAQRRLTGADASPAYIRKALEASLRRLKTDYVDIYQLHLWDHPLDEAVAVRETLEELAREGKIRGYGWSTDLLDRVQMFAEGPHCTVVQQNLNVFTGSDEVLAFCEANNLASINRAPLAMGLLTGKYAAGATFVESDIRANVRWADWFKDGQPVSAFLDRLDAVRDVLTSGGRTLAQGALAWIWGRSPVTVPIPGFKTVRQVEENAGAMAFGPLTPEQIREVDDLLAAIPST